MSQGKVSRCGDELARTALYEAAHTLLVRSKKWSSIRAWGMRIAKHRGMARARVAVAPNSPSSCIACGAIKPSSASARSQAPAPASSRPEEKRGQHHELAREGESDRSRGDDGPGDLVESPEPADCTPARS